MKMGTRFKPEAAPATVTGERSRHHATGAHPGRRRESTDPGARRPARHSRFLCAGGVHRANEGMPSRERHRLTGSPRHFFGKTAPDKGVLAVTRFKLFLYASAALLPAVAHAQSEDDQIVVV